MLLSVTSGDLRIFANFIGGMWTTDLQRAAVYHRSSGNSTVPQAAALCNTTDGAAAALHHIPRKSTAPQTFRGTKDIWAAVLNTDLQAAGLCHAPLGSSTALRTVRQQCGNTGLETAAPYADIQTATLERGPSKYSPPEQHSTTDLPAVALYTGLQRVPRDGKEESCTTYIEETVR